jgi:uncharacterized membrane protein
MQKLFSKLFRFLLQGVLVVAPIAVTVYLIYWLFNSIDNLIDVPFFDRIDPVTNKVIHHNWGLGFFIIIFSLMIIGYLSSNFITGRFFKLFDSLLERAPGVKLIYSTVKDFFEAFAGDKRKFTKPVRVLMRRDPEIWQIGFITQEDLSLMSDLPLIAVYMPHSYAVSGFTLLVDPKNVVEILNIDAADAMKMAISGGVAGYEPSEKKPTEIEE